MKRGFQLLLILAFAVLFTGCAAVRELPAEERKGEPATREFKVSRDLLVSFLNNDVKGFCEKFSPENQEKMDVKKIAETRKEMEKSLGTPVSFSYLTELEFVTFKIYVWKMKFKRMGKDPNTREEKEFFSEALVRVITGRTAKDQVVVLGFNFL